MNVALNDDEKAKVIKVYRKYSRGLWYESDTPRPGYDVISYKVTKVVRSLYYRTKEDAEKRAEEYNKRLLAYKKGRHYEIPTREIQWEDFDGTELHNRNIWWHESGSWLYHHGYTDWTVEEIMEDPSVTEMEFRFDDHKTNVDFLNLLFEVVSDFKHLTLKKNKKTNEYEIMKATKKTIAERQ